MPKPDDQLLTPEEFAALEIKPSAALVFWRRHRGSIARHLQLKTVTARCLLGCTLLALAAFVIHIGFNITERSRSLTMLSDWAARSEATQHS